MRRSRGGGWASGTSPSSRRPCARARPAATTTTTTTTSRRCRRACAPRSGEGASRRRRRPPPERASTRASRFLPQLRQQTLDGWTDRPVYPSHHSGGDALSGTRLHSAVFAVFVAIVLTRCSGYTTRPSPRPHSGVVTAQAADAAQRLAAEITSEQAGSGSVLYVVVDGVVGGVMLLDDALKPQAKPRSTAMRAQALTIAVRRSNEAPTTKQPSTRQPSTRQPSTAATRGAAAAAVQPALVGRQPGGRVHASARRPPPCSSCEASACARSC